MNFLATKECLAAYEAYTRAHRTVETRDSYYASTLRAIEETARIKYDRAAYPLYYEIVMNSWDESVNTNRHRAPKVVLDVETVLDTLNAVSNHLGISAEDMKGVRIHFDPCAGESFKYKNSMSPQFTAVFMNGEWFVTDIGCYDICQRPNKVKITLTEAAKAAVLERATRM